MAIQVADGASNVDPRILAYAHYIHAYLNLESNKPAASEKSLLAAQALLETAQSGQPPEPRDNLFVIAIKSLLGNALTGQEKFVDAENALRAAIDLSEVMGKDASEEVGTLYTNLGSCLLRKGDLEAAEKSPSYITPSASEAPQVQSICAWQRLPSSWSA